MHSSSLILHVQEVLTIFNIVSMHLKLDNTSWTFSTAKYQSSVLCWINQNWIFFCMNAANLEVIDIGTPFLSCRKKTKKKLIFYALKYLLFLAFSRKLIIN